MSNAHMQFTEIKRLEWEELMWLHEEMMEALAPRTVKAKEPIRLPEVSYVSS